MNETDGAEEKKIIKEKRREERGPAQAGRRRRQGAAAHTESWGSSPDICHEEVPLIRRYGGPGRAQMPASPVDPSLCNPNYNNTLVLLQYVLHLVWARLLTLSVLVCLPKLHSDIQNL